MLLFRLLTVELKGGELNPILDGSRSERSPVPVFSMYLLQTLQLALKTFWLLILTLLPHCCKFFRPYIVPVLIIELDPIPPNRKSKVMTTSFIAMLELLDICHINQHESREKQHESREKNLLVTSQSCIMTL